MINSSITHHGSLTLYTQHPKREIRIVVEPHKLQRPSKQTLDLLRHYIMAYLK
jgi:hypothetical protein